MSKREELSDGELDAVNGGGYFASACCYIGAAADKVSQVIHNAAQSGADATSGSTTC
jgi:hypothetical protein